jgi:hypothetical protein
MKDRHPALMVLCLALLMAGCARREFAEVEGVVTLNGQPLQEVQVLFLPDPDKGNFGNTAFGSTDEQGRYQLVCSRDGKDGTVVGPHRVCIVDLTVEEDETGKVIQPSRVPLSYADLAQTPLRNVEIRPGTQTLNFDIPTPHR